MQLIIRGHRYLIPISYSHAGIFGCRFNWLMIYRAKSQSCSSCFSFRSFILMYICTHKCAIYTRVRKYHSRSVCTEILTSPCNRQLGRAAAYTGTCTYTYMFVYVYGTIKVQVNRGGGLHGSAASKFYGSYVASENAAHYTTPKTQAVRASNFFFVSFARNAGLCDS